MTRRATRSTAASPAPGNAPWVLTVGASSHMGTVDRSDDTIAAFSSRGPGAIDYGAKPDLVAPGVGIESLSDPEQRHVLVRFRVPAERHGRDVRTLPYLSLTGTSMAAPVVAGTVALMLQANPALTPNAVKAILQYTAQPYAGYDALTQGAGFVNAQGRRGAGALPGRAAEHGLSLVAGVERALIWGNQLSRAVGSTADANAWSTR